ncbi:MAG: hypothetical protein WCD02_10540 [Terriglobales bacterium]
MRISVPLVCIVLVCSASSQTFKRHKIGESAQEFFSIATMAEKGLPTTQYCKDYLGDPKVLKAYDIAEHSIGDVKAIIQSSDVKGCKAVEEALDGREVEVGARYASEIGQGNVTFRGSQLVMIVFNLEKGTPLDDVVADINKELGGVEPMMNVDTKQNGYGATLSQRKATWNTTNVTVEASEMRSFQYGNMGVLVIVTDSAYLKTKEAERQASRPSTIH